MKHGHIAGIVALSTVAVGLTAIAQGYAQQTPAKKQPAPATAPDKATIGKPFKDFTLKNLASENGEKFSFSTLKGKKAVVGIFMANQCGTTWTYEAKIGQLIKDYSEKGVQVVAIHSNYNETDSEIVGQIEQRNLAMPVLDDKATQSLASYVGARVTPTFFIVDKEGVLRYVGAFDKYGRDPYIRPALDAILEGKKVAVTTSRAFG